MPHAMSPEERNAEARFDRAIRAAHAKLIHAFEVIEHASARQRRKLCEAREKLEEAIAIQDEYGYRQHLRQTEE